MLHFVRKMIAFRPPNFNLGDPFVIVNYGGKFVLRITECLWSDLRPEVSMRSPLATLVAFSVFLLVSQHSFAAPIVLDFNRFVQQDAPFFPADVVPQLISTSYVEDGFELTADELRVRDSRWSRLYIDAEGGTGYALNGSGLLYPWFTSFQITATSDADFQQFALSSLWLLKGSIGGSNGADSIVLSAYLEDVLIGELRHDFPDVHHTLNEWAIVDASSLGAADRIVITPFSTTVIDNFNHTLEYWVDNITLEPVRAPEPSTLWLSGIGVGLCAVRLRRQK
jgi:hypothetical protein